MRQAVAGIAVPVTRLMAPANTIMNIDLTVPGAVAIHSLDEQNRGARPVFDQSPFAASVKY